MGEAIAAPYPADTRAKGWRFELDLERIRQSDTWALAPADVRPWLLLLWATAWEQTPCGSLPCDDALIAARIGIAPKTLAKHRAILLRGWEAADDGRLYHATITQRVTEMLNRRRKEADRKALARHGMKPDDPGNPPGVPDVSHGTSTGLHPESDTGTGTGETENTNTNQPTVGSAFPTENRPPLSLVAPSPPKPKGPPDCPHAAVLALWAEVLPTLPQHNPSLWKGTRADHLRARWRESAVEKGWQTEADGLAYLRRLFAYVGASDFLAGKAKSTPGRTPFAAELAWLVKPENWAKTIEGRYHGEAA